MYIQKRDCCYHPSTRHMHVTFDFIFLESKQYFSTSSPISISSSKKKKKRNKLGYTLLHLLIFQILLLDTNYLSVIMKKNHQIDVLQNTEQENQSNISEASKTTRSCFHPYRSLTNYVQVALRKPEWTQAIMKGMKALQKNQAWSLVPLLKLKKTIRCQWVFCIKHKANGITERYKARHVENNKTQ